MSILTIILSLIFPPLAVALEKGAGKDLIINIILTLLGWLPGVIHAFYVNGK
ncbi:YqaE/Pmp3 family membrane protein [Dokdonia sp. Dokd-P16]|uniref:YqaE/Pmp3 family membrane protein n=1 Tax=Dokdonia sp. Dokd-P16 TaxID=2173169 RepID=UPI000D5440B7|nr:YqaE/Pmp3 family membrane protein [Dokdonia sp. Dokd-P16]AWH74259.1 YqaE/Pmp3 family membrane protein [Dokdonia sp. Dokd-P16]